MLKSMTAFGQASAVVGAREITVELRSVNSRYFDCSVRLPRSLGFSDDAVRPYLIAKGISRGKVDVGITADQVGEQTYGVMLDTVYADGYIAALRELRDRYGLADDISVMTVASDRGVFTSKKPDAGAEHDWDDVRPVLDAAVSAFLEARNAEGARLEADLRAKMASVAAMTLEIEKLSASDSVNTRARIEQRLRRVLDDLKIRADDQRILTECAVYADKIAIDEELVRLGSHFKAFDRILSSDEPAGRKLDFLMQEMNREVNTIGSKCQNSGASHLVVDVKCELEKIREQIQNIE